MLQIIETLGDSTRQQLLTTLPTDVFAESSALRVLLPADRHLRVFQDLLVSRGSETQQSTFSADLLIEIGGLLPKVSDAQVAELPVRLLLQESLRVHLRPVTLIRVIAAYLAENGEQSEIDVFGIVRSVLDSTQPSDRTALLRPIAKWACRDRDIVATIPLETISPVDQVQWTWPQICAGERTLWARVSPIARILAIYRAAQEECRLPFVDTVDDEPDRLVRATLLILRARFRPEWRKSTFVLSHELIQDEIAERAWDLTRPLNLYPLLPLCRPGLSVVAYCEGRDWRDEEAYCPRRSGACIKHRADLVSPTEADCYGTRDRIAAFHPDDAEMGLIKLFRRNYYHDEYLLPELTRNDPRSEPEAEWKLAGFDEQAGTFIHVRWTPLKRGGFPAGTLTQKGILLAHAQEDVFYQMRGAHIQPLRELSWQNWSLHELLATARITPDLSELRSPEEYVNLLTGWVNRLVDIREHLKCRHCNGIMRPHYGYARHLAAYRVTILSCPAEGPYHDRDVYLNHCWACASIIDSRDSRFRAGKLYICEACGSGPRPPKQLDSEGNDETYDRTRRLEKLRYEVGSSSEELTAETYAQGDICPKCGAQGMVFRAVRIYIYRKCWQCNHQLDIPASGKRTGPSCYYCRQKGHTTLVKQDDGTFHRICVECGKAQPQPRIASGVKPKGPAKGDE